MIPHMPVALAVLLTAAFLAPGHSQISDAGRFETGATMALRLEYVSGSVCELTVQVDVWKSREGRRSAALSCDRRAAMRPLTAEEAEDLLRLARSAQLYRARGIGRDARASDAWLATLKVTDGGAIVVLVVSGNPEFENGPRRELLELLEKLLFELRPRLAAAGRR